MVNLAADAEYQKQESKPLPSIPVNKGIFCDGPAQGTIGDCINTTPKSYP